MKSLLCCCLCLLGVVASATPRLILNAGVKPFATGTQAPGAAAIQYDGSTNKLYVQWGASMSVPLQSTLTTFSVYQSTAIVLTFIGTVSRPDTNSSLEVTVWGDANSNQYFVSGVSEMHMDVPDSYFWKGIVLGFTCGLLAEMAKVAYRLMRRSAPAEL